MIYNVYYLFSFLLLIFIGLSYLPGKWANLAKVLVFVASLVAINEGTYYMLGHPRPLEYLTVQNKNPSGIVLAANVSMDKKEIYVYLVQMDGQPLLITIPNNEKNNKAYKDAEKEMMQRFGQKSGYMFQGEGTEGGDGGFFVPNTLPEDKDYKNPKS